VSLGREGNPQAVRRMGTEHAAKGTARGSIRE
jgi:hypothetical protein